MPKENTVDHTVKLTMESECMALQYEFKDLKSTRSFFETSLAVIDEMASEECEDE